MIYRTPSVLITHYTFHSSGLYAVTCSLYSLCSMSSITAIAQVIPSRVGMAAPAMFIPPVIMSKLDKTATYVKNPWLKAPTTVISYFISNIDSSNVILANS